MKTILKILVIILIGLYFSACSPSSGGDAAIQTIAPADLIPGPAQDDDTSPDAPEVPPVVVAPEAPVLPPETQPPAPAPQPPADLYCYNNNGAYCTGGNLGSATVKLDVQFMMTAGDNRYTTYITQVTNNNFAKYTEICGNANRTDCFAKSACVYVQVRYVTGQTWNRIVCSNAVNTQNNTFVIHN